MKTKLSHRWQVILCVITIFILVIPTPLWAQDAVEQAQQGGKYGDLSATWWQWIYGLPAKDVHGTNTNPIFDSTGAYAAAGQKKGIGPDNKYFFLAGAFGGQVTRTVKVPAGKTIFFPVLNVEYDNFPACSPTTNYTVSQLRALAKKDIDAVVTKYARLTKEGYKHSQKLDIFRTTSPVFGYKLPSKNDLYTYVGCGDPRYAELVYPSVADGYWSVLPALDPGNYTLEFGGTIPANNFTLDVTYHLTISKGKATADDIAGTSEEDEEAPLDEDGVMHIYLPLITH